VLTSGLGEAGTPFEQEKDSLIKRETLELVRAYYPRRPRDLLPESWTILSWKILV
jgi:hypothetical protein